MKNHEIHIGLEKAELRDFFANKLRLAWESRCGKKIPYVSSRENIENAIEIAIKNVEIDIKNSINELTALNQIFTILKVIKDQGWKEFDVSDETVNCSDSRYKISFIGTEEEYNDLINRIENEQK